MSYPASRFAFGFHVTPWVRRLLIANVVVFALEMVVGRGVFYDWFGFTPTRAFTRPWGALTYMFVHVDVWHVLANMLILFFFGSPVESRLGSREFIRYYVLCGVGGVVLSFLFSPGAPIVGASAAVYGLMLAFAWHWPEAPIYVWGIFPVKAKWLVGFFFAITFLSAVSSEVGGGIAHFAHLGGLLTGLGYLKYGDRLSARLGDLRTSTETRRFAIVPRGEAKRAERAEVSARARRESVRREEELLDEVDRILDKISARGMSALTPEERRTLDEVSRRRRMN